MASSNPGDLVLDAFAGSGTTPAVTEDLSRKWVAINNSLLALETMVWRLAKGTQPMGDFSTKNASNPEQISLFENNRVLHTGLDIYLQETPDLEIVPMNTLEKWHSLLNSLANLCKESRGDM